MAGTRQPFIQYGSYQMNPDGFNTVTLPVSYSNNTYIIQATYYGTDTVYKPLTINLQTQNSFVVYGDPSLFFYWTTYGNLF